jgi:uncharacterized repeat protein (TIGR03803 family)
LYYFGSITNAAGDAFDCETPLAGLVQSSDSYFYGTTSFGGPGGFGYGIVFKISAIGTLTTLNYFGGFSDGAWPQTALVQGRDGYFYGTTVGGLGWGSGSGGLWNGVGTVFKITTNGTLTTLHSFNGSNDGANPSGGLVQGSDGYFYGTTGGDGGTVFKISTNGVLTTLYSFTLGYDGGDPNGLVQGGDGYFYGTTYSGTGPSGSGTVFKISTNGVLATIYSFKGGNDGGGPEAGLVQGSDGNFYGTTSGGGAGGFGTVFKISTNGALTTLYSFTGGNDGALPVAALVQGSDGNFYGTTSAGGAGGAGTVFRLTIVPEPPLSIILFGADVIVTWPTNYAGFDVSGYTLQSSTKLSSAVWNNISPNPIVIDGQNVVVGPITGTQQFFRLSQRLP